MVQVAGKFLEVDPSTRILARMCLPVQGVGASDNGASCCKWILARASLRACVWQCGESGQAWWGAWEACGLVVLLSVS